MTTPAELVALAKQAAAETGAARVVVELTPKGTMRVVIERAGEAASGPMDSGYVGRRKR